MHFTLLRLCGTAGVVGVVSAKVQDAVVGLQ